MSELPPGYTVICPYNYAPWVRVVWDSEGQQISEYWPDRNMTWEHHVDTLWWRWYFGNAPLTRMPRRYPGWREELALLEELGSIGG